MTSTTRAIGFGYTRPDCRERGACWQRSLRCSSCPRNGQAAIQIGASVRYEIIGPAEILSINWLRTSYPVWTRQSSCCVDEVVREQWRSQVRLGRIKRKFAKLRLIRKSESSTRILGHSVSRRVFPQPTNGPGDGRLDGTLPAPTAARGTSTASGVYRRSIGIVLRVGGCPPAPCVPGGGSEAAAIKTPGDVFIDSESMRRHGREAGAAPARHRNYNLININD